MSQIRRIDVHHHPSPPSYASTRGQDKNWKPGDDDWSVQKSLDDMERGGVATSILSLPHSVHTWPADIRESRHLARDWNEFMAKMAIDHPGRHRPGAAPCASKKARISPRSRTSGASQFGRTLVALGTACKWAHHR